MGNQQEIADLAYLAGIIDGEGSFMITRHRNKDNTKKPFRYGHRCAMSNTDQRIIDACTSTLRSLGVKYSCYKQDRRTKSNGVKHVTMHLIIANAEGIEKIVNACEPYLHGKLHRAKRIREIVRVWKEAKCEQREEFYQEFKILNARVPR